MTEWYETFFEGTALDLWRNAMTPEITGAEANFLERALELAAGHHVIDVPCGNGRLAIELAARGCRVTAVDLSPQFLEEARAGAARRDVVVDWQQVDMRRLPRNGEADALFSFGNSFGYLDHEGTVAFLTAAADSLRPGGRLAIDTGMAAESILPNLEDRMWMDVGDLRMFVTNVYDVRRSRLDTEYNFLKDGRTETKHASHAVYTVAELTRMLNAAGLSVTDLYASTEFEPYAFGAQRLLLIAKKGA